jgi:PAS domain S-box-containing protein
MEGMLNNRPHLFDSIQVAFLLADAHSKILYANQPAEDLFGYRRAEIEGQRVRLLFLAEDQAYFLANIIYLSLYQDGFKGELLVRRKDGGKIFVHLHTTSFKEKGETFITFSFQEIQRLKNLERKRFEEEHWTRLGRMVEEIAHQVRNPIVSIGGYTQRLLRNGPSSRSQPYLAKILHETGRLEKMIRQVEDYIRIPAPPFQKGRAQEVAEEALQIFSVREKVDGVSVRLEAGGMKGEGEFFIARESVIKALLNLLENSLEAVTEIPGKRRKAMIQVTLLEDREVVGISISDNGQGIKKKDLPLIFDPFFTTRPGRVGLGLTLVKRVIEIHGGQIQVKSRLKKGAVVTLYFPKDRRRRVRRELLSPIASSLGQ